MRTYVTFQYSTEFVPFSDEDGILSVQGAAWFVSLLHRVSDLDIAEELCQEDWGVIVFVKRGKKRFWIGISAWNERTWLAHVHHGSFAWRQRLSHSGKAELRRLVSDIHKILAGDREITEITWYQKGEIEKANARGSDVPD